MPKISRFGLLFAFLFALLLMGCEPSALEKAQKEASLENYEGAIQLLEKGVKEEGKIPNADTLLAGWRKSLEQQKKEQCETQVKSFVQMLADSKDLETWDKMMEEFKALKCPGIDTKPMIEKATVDFIAYLARKKPYTPALAKYCAVTGCEMGEPQIRVREEIIEETDENNKKQEKIYQDEIPIGDFERTREMFAWLFSKDRKTARLCDRYAKFLYDMFLYEEAMEVYKQIAGWKKAGFEFRQRAEMMMEKLPPLVRGAKRPEKEDASELRLFWVDEAKQKSKLKGLKRILDAEKKAEEEQKQEASTDKP